MPNIALFIDGDNVCKSTFQENYNDIKLRGKIAIRRIYFDYNDKIDEKWKLILLNNGIDSISVTNLPQKNSTDIRLMLDMLTVFYNNTNIDTFIIMSSDSDFYHIATFIRSVGKTIICYGEEKTPQMLRNVVDEFILCKTPIRLKAQAVKKIDLSKKINLTKKVDLTKKEVTDKDYNYLDEVKGCYASLSALSDEEDNITDEDKIYEEITKIDKYVVESEKIKNINWKKYDYYIEYKDKIYIIRELIDKIIGYKNVNVKTLKLADSFGNLIELLYFFNSPKLKKINIKPYTNGYTHISLTVKNIKFIYKILKKKRIVFNSFPKKSADGKVLMTYCKTPEGAFLELVQEL